MSYESDGDFFGLVSMQNKGWLAAIFGLIAIAFWMVSLSQRHDCASEVCPFAGQRPVVVEKSCVCVNEPLKTTGGTEVVATRFPEVHGLVQTAGAELGRQAIRRGRVDEELLRRGHSPWRTGSDARFFGQGRRVAERTGWAGGAGDHRHAAC